MLNAAAAVTLSVAALGPAPLTLYLFLLTNAALSSSKRYPPTGGACHRFAVLIPAHNEQALIGRLLSSLDQLAYPRERYDVHVVADNCSDLTSDLARAFSGATVHERVDRSSMAKGFALCWLIERLRADGRTYDAYVVLDADSVVDRRFLQSMDARLVAGSQVVQ